jgi:hypothetical protein
VRHSITTVNLSALCISNPFFRKTDDSTVAPLFTIPLDWSNAVRRFPDETLALGSPQTRHGPPWSLYARTRYAERGMGRFGIEELVVILAIVLLAVMFRRIGPR